MLINKAKKFILNYFHKDPEKIIIESLIKKHLPTKTVDYNASQNLFINYRKAYLDIYTDYILPLALKNINIKDSDFPKILDIGCGFAPMCLASKIYRDIWIKNKKNNNDFYYVGIDIRKDAIEYNKNNFKEYSEIFFLLHDVSNKNADYIGDFKKFKNLAPNYIMTEASSTGEETNYQIPFAYKADIQWSNSLFTHLTTSSLFNVLSFISKNLSNEGVAINTSLIIDPESLYSMKLGLADRNLKYDFGSFMSYSCNNPLLATAYKIDHLSEIYEKNNLKIIKIIKGKWRNAKQRAKSIKHNQDIIIAKKNILN
jgi:hypothetical protein